MTDEQNWQAPGAQQSAQGAPQPAPGSPSSPPPSTPPPPRPPQYGEYAPGYGAPQPPYGEQPPYGYGQQAGSGYGQQPGSGYGQQPGWTPPPKPGLIPLRPLSFGTLIGAPFQALRRNPKITVGAALLIQTIPSIVVSLLVLGGAALLFSRIANADNSDQAAITAGAIGGSIVLGLLAVVISAISGALLQGVVVGEVARGTVGEKLSFRSLWQLVKGRIGALIGWTFLLAIGWTLAVVLVVLVAVALFALGGGPGIGGGIAVVIFGGLGLLALAIWLNTKLVMVPSALVLERLSLRQAVVRSWNLTRGYFWKTFGVILLIAVIVYVVVQVISTPFSILGGLLGGIFAPTSVSTADPSGFSQLLVTQLGVNVLASIVGAIVGAVMSVVQTATVALLYIDLRMRKEGLDLELVRFVEARQSGRTDVRDPYLPPLQPAPGYGPATPGAYYGPPGPPPGSYRPPSA